ncbi:MFS transporter [Furfurilactobacillus milii]|uniref:MFS transporter n=1 Tax=Furfurilactobacillus milii TaxID=2888272 RepID=A0A6N9I5V7_9LACO|nr:MFS transporter [Furfurilactobacillus milii]MYV18370.1 MFS transporter [Furfurilactobacillus milii]
MAQNAPLNQKRKFSWPLFLSPFISRLGDALYIFGLNWFIVKATGTASILGVVQGIGGLVLVAADVLAGPLVDSVNRKRVMLWSDIISFVACLLMALIVDVNHPIFYQLVLLTAILDIGLGFNFPAAKAMVPELIQDSALQRFNAISNTSLSLADIFAPLLGGALLAVSWINFREFLLINAFSFLLSIALLLGIRYRYRPSKSGRLSIWTSLQDGFKYVMGKPVLVKMVVIDSVVNIFYAAFNLLLPYDVKHYFGGNEHLYSYLMAVMAIGGMLGGLSLVRARSARALPQIERDIYLLAVVMLIAGVWRPYPVLLAMTGLYGFLISRIGVGLFTLVQNVTDVAYLGRVFGIWFISVDFMHPLGNFIFGFVIDWLGDGTFVLMGILLALCLGFTDLVFRKHTTV